MNLLNTRLTAILMFAAATAVSLAGTDKWLEDYEKAKKQAAKNDVAILVTFSASDSCGWCQPL